MPSKAKVFLIVKGGARFSYHLLILLFYSVSQSSNNPLVKGENWEFAEAVLMEQSCKLSVGSVSSAVFYSVFVSH